MNRILSLIVVAQFFATSIWFAGNAIIKDLVIEFGLSESYLAHITSAVQIGFIIGTLFFAVFTISDRFSPSKVFFIAALSASILNLGISWFAHSGMAILLFRFGTGFFLAGIYPVGMKIAADYYDKRLGKSLGLLVGALVLGTSFPHALKAFSEGLPWAWVMYGTSILACVGGCLIILFVPDGPYRKKSQNINFLTFFEVFQIKKFRSAAFGYFGHMWELYTFWAFLPIFIGSFSGLHGINLNIALLSFIVIGMGGLSCAIGGFLTSRYLPQQIARLSLMLSGVCCILSPFFFMQNNALAFILFLLIWGMAVTADSPMFSTLVATYAPLQNKGTALTIVNCIGFALTIISIQLTQFLIPNVPASLIFIPLSIGPTLGLVAFQQVFKTPLEEAN